MKQFCYSFAVAVFILMAFYLTDAREAGELHYNILHSELMLKAFCCFILGTLLGAIGLLWPKSPRHYGDK